MSDREQAVDDFIQRAFSLDRPTPAETDTALTAARMQFADRLADRKRGSRDGRSRIPTLSDLLVEDAVRVTTPYQQQLSSVGRHEIAEEFQRFLHRTEDLQHQLSRLRGDLAATHQAVVQARDAVAAASAELTKDELLPRNPQESQAGTGAVRMRRVAMRERRIANANDELERLIREADNRQRHIDEISGRIDREFAVSQARGRRLGDYFMLRIATYWEALVRKHPDGRHLALLLPTITPSLPTWLDGTCHGGVVTLPSEVVPGDGERP